MKIILKIYILVYNTYKYKKETLSFKKKKKLLYILIDIGYQIIIKLVYNFKISRFTIVV